MASMIHRYFSLIYKSASLQVNFMKQLNCGRNNYILHTADRNNCGTDYSEVRCLQTIRRGGADPAFFVRGGGVYRRLFYNLFCRFISVQIRSNLIVFKFVFTCIF